MIDFRYSPARWATIALALLILGIGACSTPTTSELEIGQRLRLEIPASARADGSLESLLSGPGSLPDALGAMPGVDEINVSVSEEAGGPSVIDALVWGEGLDGRALAEALVTSHPELADAAIEVSPLTGKLQESVAEKVGRTLFHLDIDLASEEEMREQFLTQLKEQGFEGDAVVDVQRDGETTTIDLQLRDVGEDYETEDAFEIQVQGDPGEIELGGDDGDVARTTTEEDGKVVEKVEVKKER